jgi:hypothetical protein
MTKTIRRPNKRDLFIVGTAAALAFAPHAMAAEENRSTADAETLRIENAQLRQQLADMQKKLDGMKKGAGKPAKTATQQKPQTNPTAMKELDPAYANVGNASGVQSDPSKTAADANATKTGQAESASSKTAAEMTCGAMMKYKMPEGSQFLYNPVFGGTDNMYHTHPEGMWMFNTRLMHMEMDGLQSGTTPIASNQVGPGIFPGSAFTNIRFPYMMIPTKMSMDMGMSMVMYGVTNELTLMAMLNYRANNMNMFMDMGNIPVAPGLIPSSANLHNVLPFTSPMATAGVGDTEVDAIYKFYDDRTYGSLVGTLGLSIPTGSTTQNITMMGFTFRAPYDMQLGSGTPDLKPALTYNWISDDVRWNLGATVSGIVHMGIHDGWAFGDSFKLSSWVQYDLAQDVGAPIVTWFRMTFTDTARISGRDLKIDCLQVSCDPSNIFDVASMPDADPHNYGGQVANAFVGAYYRYNNIGFGLEGGLPVYQNLNGLQMKNSWQITGAFQTMF